MFCGVCGRDEGVRAIVLISCKEDITSFIASRSGEGVIPGECGTGERSSVER